MTSTNLRPNAGRFLSVLPFFLTVAIAGSLLAQEPARRTLRADDARAGNRDGARALMDSRRSELGLGSSALTEGRTLESDASGRLFRAHHFEQTFAGIPVEDSDIVVLTDSAGLVLLAEAKTGSDARANPVARLGLDSAIAAVLARLQGRDAVTAADLAASLVFRRSAFGDAALGGLHLYWRFECTAGGTAQDGVSLTRILYVDAESEEARIAYHAPMECAGDVKSAYVTNNLPPDDTNANFVLESQQNVELMFFCAWGGMAGPVISGAGGTYDIPPWFTCVDPLYGPGAINILGRYGSVTPDIHLWQGFGPLPAMGVDAGGGPGPGPYVHPTAGGVKFPGMPVIDPILSGAAGQVLHWHQSIRDYLAAYPGILGGVVIEAEVDVPAFLDLGVATPVGGLWRVRYGNSGVPPGGTVWRANAASSTIILHELGHICWWRATPPAVWWNPEARAINEAVGDTFAMYVTGQELVGDAWHGTGTAALRTGLNGRAYASFDPEGGPHANGEILMGSFWLMRQNLQASLGAAIGDAKAKTLFLDWLTLFDDVEMDSSILAHLLVLDDNNGNLANGTPDQAAIVGAFAAHGWPAADPAIYGIGNTPAFGAVFFDPNPARMSKLALSVLDPVVAMTPVLIVAGTPGAFAIPGLGVTSFDITLPFSFLVDGLVPGNGLVPVFPAATGADGVFDVRVGFTPTWAAGVPIAMQAFVIDPAAPFSLRMSNGLVLPLP